MHSGCDPRCPHARDKDECLLCWADFNVELERLRIQFGLSRSEFEKVIREGINMAKVIPSDHKCSPLCGIEAPDIHVETIYTSEDVTEGHIWQSLGFNRGLKVVRAVPNPDAPPSDKLPANMHHDV